MRQTFTINSERVVIRNTEKRAAAPRLRSAGRVQARRDVLERVPEVVELGGDRRLAPVPTSTEVADVDDSTVTELAYDVQSVSTHMDSSSSGVTAAPHGPGYTTPRVEDSAPTVGADNGAVAEGRHTPAAAAPTLYYQDRLVTLYHGDCLTDPALWTHADVMVTDPPYGLQALAGSYGFRNTERGSVTIAGDLDTTVRDQVLDLWGDKPAAVFGTPRLPEPPGGWTDRLVWDKAQLGLNGGAWRYAHETIFVRGEGWTRTSDASSSILRHTSSSNRRHVAKHIHSKPEKLLAELISSAPAGLLVDPFAGGGSTIAAARALGRPIIAFELEEEYCAGIVERVASRLDVFDETLLGGAADGSGARLLDRPGATGDGA